MTTYISTGARAIQAERHRQIEQEGWTPEHDDTHVNGEIAEAAACYVLAVNDGAGSGVPARWPWHREWWKPSMGDNPRRDLVKAGALIAAEIDRLDRMSGEANQ